MEQITFEIKRKIAVLSPAKNGWQLEFNEVSWNERKPNLEIRRWEANHTRGRKGVVLSRSEAKELLKALRKEFADDSE